MAKRNPAKFKVGVIEAFGSACQRCGYNRCVRALHFHHIDSSHKQDYSTYERAYNEEVKAHPERFILLCANCHIEEHDRLDSEKRVYATCIGCGAQFPSASARPKEGRDKFCTRECYAQNRSLIAKPLAERFEKYVDKSGECWRWTGYTDKRGLGYVARSTGRPMLASRAAWEVHHGAIPIAAIVLHTCDNAWCVNPDHLFLGSNRDKMRQASYRGRTSRGEKSVMAKVTADQVREIRQRYAAGGISQKRLGQEYGLSQGSIGDIIRRATWQDVA